MGKMKLAILVLEPLYTEIRLHKYFAFQSYPELAGKLNGHLPPNTRILYSDDGLTIDPPADREVVARLRYEELW